MQQKTTKFASIVFAVILLVLGFSPSFAATNEDVVPCQVTKGFAVNAGTLDAYNEPETGTLHRMLDAVLPGNLMLHYAMTHQDGTCWIRITDQTYRLLWVKMDDWLQAEQMQSEPTVLPSLQGQQPSAQATVVPSGQASTHAYCDSRYTDCTPLLENFVVIHAHGDNGESAIVCDSNLIPRTMPYWNIYYIQIMDWQYERDFIIENVRAALGNQTWTLQAPQTIGCDQ